MNLKKIKKVYFLCSQIPKGFVSTYKEISNYSGIDPRSVGRALKLNLEVNPFSKVPCHRVISVNFFIGGYCGEWGKGKKIEKKRDILFSEGIKFDNKGFLEKSQRERNIFRNFHD